MLNSPDISKTLNFNILATFGCRNWFGVCNVTCDIMCHYLMLVAVENILVHIPFSILFFSFILFFWHYTFSEWSLKCSSVSETPARYRNPHIYQGFQWWNPMKDYNNTQLWFKLEFPIFKFHIWFQLPTKCDFESPSRHTVRFASIVSRLFKILCCRRRPFLLCFRIFHFHLAGELTIS